MAPSSFSSDASSSSGSTRDWIFFVIVMISRAESTRGREEDKEEGSEEDAARPSEAEAEPELN
jgi:hypothetical protein